VAAHALLCRQEVVETRMRVDEQGTQDFVNEVAALILAVEALERSGPLTDRQRTLVDHLLRSTHGLEQVTKGAVARALGWEHDGHTLAVERRAAPRWD
jgi:hypothetical protein